MIINHNMSAVNALRNSSSNLKAAGNSMEKLSSGLKINRAGDDAAGLSISEKMRAQIRGLDQASSNAQDGISLVQTAEGALNETHNILQRMRELTVQGANDTNKDDERAAIQQELDQLTEEITRISDTTEFNGQNLLGGGFDGTFQIGANQGQTINLKINSMSAKDLGLTGGVKLPTKSDYVDEKDTVESDKVTAKGDKALTNLASLADGVYTAKVDNEGVGSLLDRKGNVVASVDKEGTLTLKDKDSNDVTIKLGHTLNNGATVTKNATSTTITLEAKTLAEGEKAQLSAGDYKVSGNNLFLGDRVVGTLGTTDDDRTTLTLNEGKGTVKLEDLGLTKDDLESDDKFTIESLNVSTNEKAGGSTATLDKAITAVSSERSKLGAIQNRLEHTIANLDNTSENLTSAESRIRDVDMAKEMSTFSKNNILQQAAQAMLAQANQQPQSVLQLLR